MANLPTHAQPDIPPEVLARRWGILGVLCTSLIIVIVGNTSLNVALPRLAEDLDASTTDLQWMVDAYSLCFAGLLLTAGALGDRYGRKGALQLGLSVFGLASLFAAFGDSSEQVTAARAVMGLAAAFVMPSTLSILTNVFPAHERARAIAIWAGISASGAAIGPVASGFLLEHYWWGSVFLVNIPIILGALLVGRVLLPKSSDPSHAPLDPVGAVLSAVGMVALVYAIIEAPNHGWTSGTSIAWFAGGVVVLLAFGLWERSRRHPMLDLRLFSDRRFSVSSAGITLLFFAMFGTLFLGTQYLQLVLGYSPLEAGLRLLPQSIVLALVAPQTPKLVTRFGANRVASTGLVLVSAALASLTLWEVDTPYAQVIVSLMVMAAGMALTMAPMTAELMSAVPPAKAGVGSAMNDTTRELGGALGVALFGSIVAGQYASGIADRLSELPDRLRDLADTSVSTAVAIAETPGRFGLSLDDDTRKAILSTGRSSFLEGFHLAALLGSVVLAIAAVVVFRLLPAMRHDPLLAEPEDRVEAPTP